VCQALHEMTKGTPASPSREVLDVDKGVVEYRSASVPAFKDVALLRPCVKEPHSRPFPLDRASRASFPDGYIHSADIIRKAGDRAIPRCHEWLERLCCGECHRCQ